VLPCGLLGLSPQHYTMRLTTEPMGFKGGHRFKSLASIAYGHDRCAISPAPRLARESECLARLRSIRAMGDFRSSESPLDRGRICPDTLHKMY
jgi:hypothetical protein